MIEGTGIDIVDIGRFKRAVERHGERLLLRLFTDGELSYCIGKRRPEEHLAARFAAKEAFFKATNNRSNPFRFREVDIRRDADGRPYIVSTHLGKGQRSSLAMSHDGGFSIAQVVVESI